MIRTHSRIGLLVLLAVSAAGAAQGDGDLSPYYGFGPLEILKSDFGLHSLTISDLTGNGLNDIAVVNNQRSRIELYIQNDDPNALPTLNDPEHVNELVGFGRFERQTLLLTIQPGNMVCGDLNGSGRQDIAVYAEPAGLYVFYQDKPGRNDELSWQSPRRIAIQDGLRSRAALVCGDLNGNGRDDLIVAGSNAVFVVLQNEDGTLADPVEYPSHGRILQIRLLDFDGDGLNDLVCVTDDRHYPLHVRFGQPDGRLGPVVPYKTEPFTDFQMLDEPRTMLSVERVSGRLTGSQLRSVPAAGDDEPFVMLVYPLADGGDNARRDMVLADVDGSGHNDVLISRPGQAQMTLFRNSPTGLGRPYDFPALADVTTLAAADLDGSGRDTVVMLSIPERTIGISRYENVRMTFPVPIRIPLEPVAMALADMNSDGTVQCAYIGRDEDGDGRYLGVVNIAPDGATAPYGEPLKLDELPSNPQGMMIADIDQDGLMDVLIFRAFEEPLVIRQTAEFVFETIPRRQSQSGLIKAASRQSLTTADTTQDGKAELLLSQQNFARALVFGADGAWSILEQYNAAGREDEIAAAALHDIDGDGAPEMILLDRRNQQLQILKPDDSGAYRVSATAPIGRWNPSGQLKLFFENLHGSGEHLVLFDGDKFAFVLAKENLDPDFGIELQRVFSWETRIRDGRYAHFAVGDVNAAGREDIVLVESRKNHLDILTYDVNDGLFRILQGTRFKLFEEKSFGRPSSMGAVEPRELLIADVTGNNAADIIALIHDRIIIYPQDL